jgi:phosphoserine phosphatase
VRWEAKGYSNYIEWMKDTIRIHQRHSLTAKLFRSLIDAAEYNPGVLEAFRKIDRNLFVPVMVTGGFRELATRRRRSVPVVVE